MCISSFIYLKIIISLSPSHQSHFLPLVIITHPYSRILSFWTLVIAPAERGSALEGQNSVLWILSPSAPLRSDFSSICVPQFPWDTSPS